MTDSKYKRTSVVSQACVSCKKRHLKCDGAQPCIQCKSRNLECCFGSQMKRGRKSAVDKLLNSSPERSLVSISNSNFHFAYLENGKQTLSMTFPTFTPKSFRFSEDSSSVFEVTINPELANLEKLDSILPKLSFQEQLKALEYVHLCSLGARMCSPTTDLSSYYTNKTKDILSALLFQTVDPNLADHYTNILLLIAFQSTLNLDYDQSNLVGYQALAIYNNMRSHVTCDTKNRLYAQLSGCSKDMETKRLFLSKIHDYNDVRNFICTYFYACSVIPTSVSSHVSCGGLLTPQQEADIFNKLMELHNNTVNMIEGMDLDEGLLQVFRPLSKIYENYLRTKILREVTHGTEEAVRELIAVSNRNGSAKVYVTVGVYLGLQSIDPASLSYEMAEYFHENLGQLELFYPTAGKFRNLLMLERPVKIETASSENNSPISLGSPSDSTSSEDFGDLTRDQIEQLLYNEPCSDEKIPGNSPYYDDLANLLDDSLQVFV